jgi:hypothetical protein
MADGFAGFFKLAFAAIIFSALSMLGLTIWGVYSLVQFLTH